MFLMNCPTRTTAMFCGDRMQTIPPRMYSTKPARVVFRFPKRLARGHTAKMPIPMGMPPMTDTMVWVTPSL